jgi:hypothetical protein
MYVLRRLLLLVAEQEKGGYVQAGVTIANTHPLCCWWLAGRRSPKYLIHAGLKTADQSCVYATV